MKQIEIRVPAMGEGITEASVIKFLKTPGNQVEEDEVVVEIATDKVDTEIVAPCNGQIEKFFFKEGDIAQVGDVLFIMNTETEIEKPHVEINVKLLECENFEHISKSNISGAELNPVKAENILYTSKTESDKLLSPLVRSIAKNEGISLQELNEIQGSGLANRITKVDVLAYSLKKKSKPESKQINIELPINSKQSNLKDEIIEMDRMRKLIALNMIGSKKTSAHVTSFVEVDLTNIVNWRNGIKDNFLSKYKEKITFTPIFIEAIVQAIKEFPMINSSIEGTNIILKKDINMGMATALPNGNLIVPVIKNAADLSLLGIIKKVNDLADRARLNKLKPDEIQGGTFTMTNVGTFGNLTGTPIINQPQVAILAIGAIKKKPCVIETSYGDTIGIRQLMIMSMSYDHRIIDGALGGMFLKSVADILESFNKNREI